VTKTQSAGPISCLKHRATRVLHCTTVTRAAVLMFPLLLQAVISNQMRPRRLRGGVYQRTTNSVMCQRKLNVTKDYRLSNPNSSFDLVYRHKPLALAGWKISSSKSSGGNVVSFDSTAFNSPHMHSMNVEFVLNKWRNAAKHNSCNINGLHRSEYTKNKFGDATFSIAGTITLCQ